MPRITPIHYKKLGKVFEYLSFRLDRQEGDHLIYVKNRNKKTHCNTHVQRCTCFYYKEQH